MEDVRMVRIRRLQDEGAGFIKDVSDIIAAEAWKNPSLIPDLSKDLDFGHLG
jgi:hypothetical protein